MNYADMLDWATEHWMWRLEREVDLADGDDPIAAADAVTSLADARIGYAQALIAKVSFEEGW